MTDQVNSDIHDETKIMRMLVCVNKVSTFEISSSATVIAKRGLKNKDVSNIDAWRNYILWVYSIYQPARY